MITIMIGDGGGEGSLNPNHDFENISQSEPKIAWFADALSRDVITVVVYAAVQITVTLLASGT